MSKYLDIVLTDIRLHAQKPAHPKPADRVLRKSVKTGKEQRVHRPLDKSSINAKTKTFDVTILREDEIQRLQSLAAKRGKQLRLIMPKGGLNLYLAPDGFEKLKALQKRGKL